MAKNRKNKGPQSNPNAAPKNASARVLSNEEIAGPQNLWRRLSDKSSHVSNWSTFGAFCIAFIGLLFQWKQISDLKQGKNDSDRQIQLFAQQIEILRSSIEKSRDLEVLPRLLVECPVERVEMSAAGHLLTDGKVRIRNIGRGAAYNVVATVTFDRLNVGAEPVGGWEGKLDLRSPIAKKTIPPGDTIPFDDFDYPLANSKDPQGLGGTIGLYCTNEDGKEIIETQKFLFVVHLQEGRPHAHLDFKTPDRHSALAQPLQRNYRTVTEIAGLLRLLSKKE